MNGRMTDIIRSMPQDKALMCWTGTLYDRKHPNMRCDSVRLLTVHRTAWVATFRATAGYRRAAVMDTADLCESDYKYVYDLRTDLRIITGASDRAGRFALPGDLLDWETSVSATDQSLLDVDDKFEMDRLPSNSAARRMEMLFNEYVTSSDVASLDYIPVPEMVLVASRGARVFPRPGVENPAEPLETEGKLEYLAHHYYGQGVLAMRPGYPAGHWWLVPVDAVVDGRNDIEVNMDVKRNGV